MALVHEKLYQSHSLASIALGDYARDLLRHIGDAASVSSRGIEILSAVTDIDAALDAAIPFGLLLNELVFNALEHAFEGRSGGRVRVLLVLQDGVPLLRVQDNGMGLKPEFSCSQATGMGLQLATSLATQLGGSLQSSSGGQGGAEFVARLPGLLRQAG
jgi:two-component sensor histidine kinase